MSIRGYILLGWKNARGALATQTKYVVIGGQNKKYNNEYYNSVVSFLWTRFYNNAAKSFGAEGILRRRLGRIVLYVGYKESGRPCESKSSTNVIFFENIFLRAKITPKVAEF